LAYHEISIMDVWEVIRRWHARQGLREIARSLGYDRNTVRHYTRVARSRGLSPESPLPSKDEVLRLLETAEPSSGRLPQAQTALTPYLEEIAELIQDRELALKPKNAFLVICERHALTDKVSYTSFRRFLHAHRSELGLVQSTCRVEMPPGSELQLDYAKVCLFFDPATERRRQLFAFIGTLSHSRLKYVELTFRQDQTSFVSSHVRMFEFFSGVPERLVPDNLKAGVITPDLYDPSLNRSYREMAEHYGSFIDAARVHKPKDKGKVERDVQTIRQAVRVQIVLNPSVTIAELNQAMKGWSVQDYGQRTHGTTREKPALVFKEREQPALKPLPAERFEIATWKQATVHPDHYVQYQGKAFSVPTAYVTKKVWIQATEHLVKVFYEERLIAQHVITGAYRHTNYEHFPDNVRSVLDTSTVHKNLLERAAQIGGDFHTLIRELLEVHAYLNLRRAQGLLAAAEAAEAPVLVNRAAGLMREQHVRGTPRELRWILEKLRTEDEQQAAARSLADLSQEFVRDVSYFINHNSHEEGNA
jgi:transposase